MSAGRRVAAVLVTGTLAFGITAAPAAAVNPCKVAGVVSGLLGKGCELATHPGRVLSAGKKLFSGNPGGAIGTLLSDGASAATKTVGLAAIGAWVLAGASFALHETAKLVNKTTSPQLRSTWFSGTYWQMAGIATVLTLPFLFAAAVQALVRSDVSLLMRAAFGYLPLAMLAVGVAAPMTMLLLAVSDQMSAAVSSAAGGSGVHFLASVTIAGGGIAAIAGAPFIAFLIGLLTAAGAVVLWVELLMRDAAIYVIVLMLPLVFAALVWPSRRVWAIRAVELLVALIFAKFAIVAILSLGGAAFSGTVIEGVTGWLAGVAILIMGAFAPWAMLRLLPLADLAGTALHSLHSDARSVTQPMNTAQGVAERGWDWATATTGQMRRDLGAAGDAVRRTRPPELPALESGPEPEGGGRSGGPEPEAGGPAPPDPQPSGQLSSQTEARLPGLGGRWQARNYEWQPLRLGPEESWPNPTVWSPSGGVPGAGSTDGEGPPGPAPPAGAPPGPAAPAGAPPGRAGAVTAPFQSALPSVTTDAVPPSSRPRNVSADSASGATEPAPTHDDPDPRPPAQDPPDGRL